MSQQNHKIIFCITNDISYDQRMQRICTSLQQAGYNVTLVGRKQKASIVLPHFNFNTKRLPCFFEKGFLFYAEFNLRLLLYLITQKTNAICAIDLDTIVPVYFASIIKNKPRLYDAHELFTEQKEIVTRKRVKKIWLSIEKFFVPKFKYGYTVNNFIKNELNKRYKVNYGIIRNLPILTSYNVELSPQTEPFIIYQGAVNEGRAFETIIPAMQNVNCTLQIYGTGNFYKQTQELIKKYELENKVILKGAVPPQALKTITPQAYIGLTLFEATGLNQYYSLANRFFDYVMAGIPQICVNYPEYKAINEEYNFALLIPNVEPLTIANAINTLLENENLHHTLQQNCLKAREVLNWNVEQEKLITYWQRILPV